MIGLIRWVRSFTYDQNGAIVRNANGPVFTAHPQPNLWRLLAAQAAEDAHSFDMVQLPPATKGQGEGYAVTCLRNYNSNWGLEAELIEAINAEHAQGVSVCLDLVYRQMGGENGGPGVFNYPSGVGNTIPSWFQYFGQPGESMPPFVPQDDVPDPSGNYAFGRVRSLQNSIPKGAVEADTKDALADILTVLPIVPGKDRGRFDDGKGMHAPSCLRILRSQNNIEIIVEFFSGDPKELDWYVRTVMQKRVCVEDFSQYWCTQRACNQYDARQFDSGGGGYWRLNAGASFIFTNNPDVATSWSPTGGISQQIAFNLLIGIVHDSCLPCKGYLAYAEDYFPASPDYPTGRGLKSYMDNLFWFARKFAFGAFKRIWQDKDVYAYYRDGEGGEVGWSGGCIVVTNFNTLEARTITVEVPPSWNVGDSVHNYSTTGRNEYYTVGHSGLTMTVKSNYYSDGQSYLLIAKSGVSGAVRNPPIVA